MKNLNKIMNCGLMGLALMGSVMCAQAQTKATWGDFKLWIDPGHSGTENGGLYGYTEAQKVLRVGLATRDFLKLYTDATDDQIKMTRTTDTESVGLDERSDMANAWGADFFYSIHSDSGSDSNSTLFLFGGWNNNGVSIEKTPNGGKKFGDILEPNLTHVMYNTTSRGVYYDRCYYMPNIDTHENQYPYLSVNRRTNMASLLSEGGFHTNPVQQPLNMNESYKHLEAFGTYRAILKYRGIECPTHVMLAGVIKNSENNVPVDGVTVTVDGKTVVTDSYASLFNKFTKNENLIHNGFFLFEGLETGKQYTVTYSCPGYSDASQVVTMKSNPQGDSGDNVTWANISLTANAPSKVTSISIEDPTKVSLSKDVVITFSRYMDKQSVESAFSINNSGKVTMSWDNDYTLRLKISQLMEEMDYTITIKGDVAKNSQTSQFLDGDANGTEGGDYTFSFTTMPADKEAPYIVSTTPTENTTMLYTTRPVIRLEYNEQLAWNDDNAVDFVVVEDKDGNKYDGVLKHEVVNGASVLHYFFKSDLPMDKCFKVTVSGGVKDLSGNVGTGKVFKFLSEYHTILSQGVIDATFDVNAWYSPTGSGTSDGWTLEGNTMEATTNTSSLSQPSAFLVKFSFDPDTQDAFWRLRIYFRNGAYATKSDVTVQAYVHGDGSNNLVGHCYRDKGDRTEGGVVKCQPLKPMNFRGWNIVASKPYEETLTNISGTIPTFVGSWMYDSFFVQHLNTDDNDQVPQQAWKGEFSFDDLKWVNYNPASVQKASLDDITVSGVEEINASDITVVQNGESLVVNAPKVIKAVKIYNMGGMEVASKLPVASSSTISTTSLEAGVYVVKIVTGHKTLAVKVVIK